MLHHRSPVALEDPAKAKSQPLAAPAGQFRRPELGSGPLELVAIAFFLFLHICAETKRKDRKFLQLISSDCPT
ncbi:hypothetical protein VTN49DRAFT_8013 [Thermomyces lanuginosus]|uniref:uncharacterized protein n=1 Tax=Thermomyces lanuginosus TaxID=5541 RepID=UPI003743FD36